MCTVSFKVDETVKTQAQELFDELGLSFSGALNIFLKSCINNGGIPFSLTAPRFKEIVLNRIKEADNPENLSPAFSSIEDLRKALDV
ncbi:MAG: type II toxin-antitoxin system RelB/DinJ family antitoxin [Sphaerochaetaceae bacterium]|nr:type II toxin-antitoxin system RelB/DinJ family antitoxin [Sphaerochaetaceae bacterium]